MFKLFLIVFSHRSRFQVRGDEFAGSSGLSVGLMHERTLLRVASTFLLLVRVLLDGARTILAVLCMILRINAVYASLGGTAQSP